MPTETVKKALPWRAGAPAWIMAVEGAIIAVLGMYVIDQPTNAARVLLIALGALMLFNGVPKVSRYYHRPEEERAESDMLSGWFGTVVGGGAIILTLLADNPDSLVWVAILLGIALIIAGVLESFERFSANKGHRRLVQFIMPLILILAGLSLVGLRVSDRLTPLLVGQILALLGFALLAIGLVRMWGNHKARQAAKEAEEKRLLLAKEIADADAKAGKTATPAPAPAAAAPPPAPAAAAPSAPPPAAPVAPPAPAATPADDPEDPAVSASLDQ